MLGRWIRRAILAAIVLLLLWFVVIPQFAEARAGLASLHNISLPLILLGVGCEVASLAALGLLAREVLYPGDRPGYFTVLRVRLTDLGVNNVVPGGGAVALAVRYRLLTLLGVTSGDAISSAGIEIAVATVVLGAIFGAGVAFAAPSPSASFYPLAAVVLVGVFVLAVVAFVLILRFRLQTERMVAALTSRFPRFPERWILAFIDSVAANLAHFVRNRPRLARTLLWAFANWLLDAASLWIFLAAFGHRFQPGELLLAYGLASLLGMVPITAGGLGVIEGVLVPALVAFGALHTDVVLGVVAWRLVEYWLPIPVSLLAYGSLRFGPLRTRRSPDVDEQAPQTVHA